MLGGTTGLLGPTGDGAALEEGRDGAAATAVDGGGGGSLVGVAATAAEAATAGGIRDQDDKGRIGDFGERVGSAAGNRWPRQETLALMEIRSDMDVIFRDSSPKGSLWEDVSRKMAELGYQRSAKKCKEKFENLYKYYKRTKEGRAGKFDGKTYRFFEQLEAFEINSAASHHHHLSVLPPQPVLPFSIAMPPTTASNIPSTPAATADDAQALNSIHPPAVPSQIINTQFQQQSPTLPQQFPSFPGGSHSSTPSSSSSTSSDHQISGTGKRKRKWRDFFERLMKEVMDKQEELQTRFLEAMEKQERERLAQEEARKVEEMARLNRDHEILVQERSMAAAKDAALIGFLQKLSEQQQILIPLQFLQPQTNMNTNNPMAARRQPAANPLVTTQLPRQQHPQPGPMQDTSSDAMAVATLKPFSQPLSLPPQSKQQQQLALSTVIANEDTTKPTKGESNPALPPTSSRWPKAEVQALIDLRTNMDQMYQDSSPKGPLWEEISAAMRGLGYNRSAKRCKEKWENINKYFKKVKESNKKRPEDSKTCPYFHQLDAIYRQKGINKIEYNLTGGGGAAAALAAAGSAPIMARPEQQWPLPEDPPSNNGPDHDGSDEDWEEEEEEEDQRYEVVANSNATRTAAASVGAGGRGERGGAAKMESC